MGSLWCRVVRPLFFSFRLGRVLPAGDASFGPGSIGTPRVARIAGVAGIAGVAAAAGLVGALGCNSQGCSGEACEANTFESTPTSQGSDAASPSAEVSAEPPSPGPDVAECQVKEDCPDSRPVCSPLNQCIVCNGNSDCTEDQPYCKLAADEKANRCVACQVETECGAAGKWRCVDEQCYAACEPGAVEPCEGDLVCVTDRAKTEPYCAECGPGVECANSDLVCVGNTCVTCNPEDDSGCSGNTPFCVVPGLAAVDAGTTDVAAATCRQCRDGKDDCEGGACVNGECQFCSPEDNGGCDTETPFCIVTESLVGRDGEDAGALDGGTAAEFSCVQCVNNGDCSAGSEGPFCIAGRCAACDPETDDGCSGELGECATVASADAGSASYACRECDVSCPGSDVCLDFECVECAGNADCKSPSKPHCSGDNTCVGCVDNSSCSEQVGLPFCNEDSGACVACRTDEDCADSEGTPGCRPDLHVCAECTRGSHCPENALGCELIPGREYTCTFPVEPGPVGECSLCNAGDCAPGLGCAETESGEPRCLPLAEGDAGCATILTSVDEGTSLLYCIPETCGG